MSPSQVQVGHHRALIVNADDFGLTEGTSCGILRAWRDGIVTSVSVLINMDGALEQLSQALAESPELPVGLHINITTGSPVLPQEQIPTLVAKDCGFHSMAAILKHPQQINLSQLHAEIVAQIAALQSTGAQLDHLDSHHQILALHPSFFDVMCKVASDYNVPLRCPQTLSSARHLLFSRSSYQALHTIGQLAFSNPSQAIQLLSYMLLRGSRRQRRLLDQREIDSPEAMIPGFLGQPTLERFVSILRSLPPGTSELVVHPAVVDSALRKSGAMLVDSRADELAILIDPRLRQAARQGAVPLVSYSSLRRAEMLRSDFASSGFPDYP